MHNIYFIVLNWRPRPVDRRHRPAWAAHGPMAVEERLTFKKGIERCEGCAWTSMGQTVF